MATSIAALYGLKAYIADPVIVDEMEPLAASQAGLAGEIHLPCLEPEGGSPALCERDGNNHEQLKLVVTPGRRSLWRAHRYGRVIGVNNALGGEDLIRLNVRAACLFPVMELCYSGRHSLTELKKSFVGGEVWSLTWGPVMRLPLAEKSKRGTRMPGIFLRAWLTRSPRKSVQRQRSLGVTLMPLF